MENEGGEKMRKGPAERTAVVLDQHPLWPEAMEQLL